MTNHEKIGTGFSTIQGLRYESAFSNIDRLFRLVAYSWRGLAVRAGKRGLPKFQLLDLGFRYLDFVRNRSYQRRNSVLLRIVVTGHRLR